MGKSLLSKLGRGIKKGALIAAALASIGFAGCKPFATNFPPSANLEASLISDNNYTITLDGTDPNGKSDILEYILTEKYADGKEEKIKSSSPITMSRNYNKDVTLNGECIDSQNAIGNAEPLQITISPSQIDYIDISGKLEDCENDGTVPVQGEIKLLDNLDNPIKITEIRNGSLIDNYIAKTDLDGYFDFTLDKLVTSLSQVKIKARSTNPSNSYVRTITVDVNSNSNVEPDVIVNPIRVVPYPDFDNDEAADNIDTFKTFMEQINSSYNGVRGFDLNEIITNNGGIEILRGDPLNRGFNFTPENQDFIEGKINDVNDIGVYVEKRDLNEANPGWIDVQVDTNDPNENPADKKYDIVGGKIVPYPGWIVVAPKDTAGGETFLFGGLDGILIKRARIDLGGVNNSIPPINLGGVNDGVPTHEFGHVFIASNPLTDGHSTILDNRYTIMTATNLKSPPPGVADEKAAKIIYEDTYQYGEDLNNILGDVE